MKRKWIWVVVALAVAGAIVGLWLGGAWLWAKLVELHGAHGVH
jgi:hypothetical protein